MMPSLAHAQNLIILLCGGLETPIFASDAGKEQTYFVFVFLFQFNISVFMLLVRGENREWKQRKRECQAAKGQTWSQTLYGNLKGDVPYSELVNRLLHKKKHRTRPESKTVTHLFLELSFEASLLHVLLEICTQPNLS